MSAPIHWKGTDYDSVEAMPPNIRASYEQSQRDKAQNQQAQPEVQSGHEHERGEPPAQPFQRAWGGPRPKGSVPVPAEFESVTSLGPADAVLEEAPGISFGLNIGTPLAKVLVRYRDGFAFRAGGKDIHTWRWDEVAAIQTNNSWHSGGRESYSYTWHEYTLTKHSGEKVILDGTLKDIGDLEHIKHAVFALLEPPLAQRYRGGEALTFGPVTIDHQNGLQMDGKPYAWDAIQNIEVERGRFKITLKDGKHHDVRVSAIPNIELLCQLIGLNLYSGELAYY